MEKSEESCKEMFISHLRQKVKEARSSGKITPLGIQGVPLYLIVRNTQIFLIQGGEYNVFFNKRALFNHIIHNILGIEEKKDIVVSTILVLDNKVDPIIFYIENEKGEKSIPSKIITQDVVSYSEISESTLQDIAKISIPPETEIVEIEREEIGKTHIFNIVKVPIGFSIYFFDTLSKSVCSVGFLRLSDAAGKINGIDAEIVNKIKNYDK